MRTQNRALWGHWLLVVGLASTLTYTQESSHKDPADSEVGELVTTGNIHVRFGVWRRKTVWSDETGYLDFSSDRVRYQVVRPKGAEGFDKPRSDLRSAALGTCCLGLWPVVHFDFGDRAVWDFAHVTRKKVERGRLGTNRSEDFLDQNSLVMAANNFDALLSGLKAKVQQAKPAPATGTPTLQAPSIEPQGTTLSLSTQPGNVDVYLDDKFEGSTDAQGKKVVTSLQPGSHRLRLNANGYNEFTREVLLSSDENTAVTVRLEIAGPKPLTDGEVEELLTSGVAKSRIIQLLNRYGVNFALTEKTEKELRSLGADDSILLAIAKAKK
jgi:PEGA domain